MTILMKGRRLLREPLNRLGQEGGMESERVGVEALHLRTTPDSHLRSHERSAPLRPNCDRRMTR